MPYILSKLANTQIYTKYAKGANNLNLVVAKVEIKGGADVTDKHLVTPEGVITEVTSDELEILKENPDFQKHLERGHVKYFGIKPNIEKNAQKMEKDNSKPLTPSDYEKQGKKAPKTTTGE